jgi:predicted nucleotidyltransferase
MTIENKIIKFFENEKDVVAVYLFGSYASGKPRVGSDIDLAILFSDQQSEVISDRIDKYQIGLCRILRKDLHLIAMDFAGEEILKQIFRTGKCLLINDFKKLTSFRTTAYTKIANFHYYLRQMQSGLIRKLMEEV